ncbi:MAG: TIGR03750 family conjugal transfer protein [Flavobacteriaceae bacterium]|jgi:hypothetical protein|nr:TIGR03750 family conjugal transfer protein [Flavobacteriaceae bacterium]
MNKKVGIILFVLMLIFGVILVVLGYAWALIPTFIAYLIIFVVVSIVKAIRDVKQGKQVDGFNVCYHNYKLIKTTKVSYGVNNGIEENTYYTYKCTKCGQEITKNKNGK